MQILTEMGYKVAVAEQKETRDDMETRLKKGKGVDEYDDLFSDAEE